jgi:hypothetical protein
MKTIKKILLWMMLLLTVSILYSQETFVRKYNYMIVTKDGVSGLSREADLTVIFNYNQEKQIKFHYATGETQEYYQVSQLIEGKTKSGEQYQLIKIIDKKDGYQFILQLFDKIGAMRLIFSENNSVEFYEK